MPHSDELEVQDKSAREGESFSKQRQKHQARLRRHVLERDGACVGCGAPENLQAAHIIPVAELIRDMDMLAAHDPRLAVCLCRRCHLIFDGTEIFPEDSEEMNRLIEARYDRAVECLGGEPDRMDIEFLARSDEQTRCINDQMRKLFERARAHRAEIADRMMGYIVRVVLREEAPSHEIGSGWSSDVIYRMFDIAFEEFVSRSRFFEIEKEHKEIAHRAGLHFSWRLKLWYGPQGAHLRDVAQDKRAREIRDIPAWQQSLHEREQGQREARARILREKAEKQQEKKEAMQRAILASMSTQPITVREISRVTGLTYGQVHNEIYPNSLSLYAQGLVERHAGHGGRSAAIAYSLTPKGVLLVEAMNVKDGSAD